MRKQKSNRSGCFIVLCWALLLISSNPAKADSVTYSFSGSAWLTGTSFTYVSPSGFLSFDTGPLVPTTAGDVFFYDVSGAYFRNDIGQLATFDFASEDELILHTNTGCSLDFTLVGGFSHAHSICPADQINAGSSVLGFGYLLNVYTNFDVVGAGEIGVTPTQTGPGPAPEPSSLILLAFGLVAVSFVRRCRRISTDVASGIR